VSGSLAQRQAVGARRRTSWRVLPAGDDWPDKCRIKKRVPFGRSLRRDGLTQQDRRDERSAGTKAEAHDRSATGRRQAYKRGDAPTRRDPRPPLPHRRGAGQPGFSSLLTSSPSCSSARAGRPPSRPASACVSGGCTSRRSAGASNELLSIDTLAALIEALAERPTKACR